MTYRLLAVVAWVGSLGCFNPPVQIGLEDAGVVVDAGVVPDAGTPVCGECVLSTGCAEQGACVQVGGDDRCARRCSSPGECPPDARCLSTSSIEGTPVQVCVPLIGSCVAPGCGTCATGTTCDFQTGTCIVPLPTDAGALADGGTTPGAGPITGTVGPDGGVVSRLYFAVVGDTRPSLPDITATYPTAVITKIFKGIEQMNPRPQFTLGTGDYVFATPFTKQGAAQLSLYLGARANYSGPFFPALGNHECTGATGSQCAGVTNNNTYNAYLSMMLPPIGKKLPYYSFDVNGADGTWTSKFVVIACNAWDTAQATWLQLQLSRPTTYTFVTRHQPLKTGAPCTTQSDALLNQYPHDILIVGHAHTFSRSGKQLIVGNGGAPIVGSTPFGYATIEQIPGTGFKVTQYDSAMGLPVSSFMMP